MPTFKRYQGKHINSKHPHYKTARCSGWYRNSEPETNCWVGWGDLEVGNCLTEAEHECTEDTSTFLSNLKLAFVRELKRFMPEREPIYW